MATGRDVHIDTPLTNLVIGFEPQGTIVQDIFPEVNVTKQSNKYYVWNKGDFFRRVDGNFSKRSPKTNAKRVGFDVASDSYFSDNYALGTELTFEDIANSDNVLNLREKYARGVHNLLMLDWEVRVASQISSGSNVGSFTTLSGTDQWSDFANSDPVNDIAIGKEAIRSTTGLRANLAIIPEAVMIQLKQHPDIIDRIKYTQKGIVTADLVAQVFEVDKILVPEAIVNTAGKGLPDSFSDVWGKNVVLAHVTNGPDPDGKDPSLGYSFRWTDPLLGTPLVAERWNDPNNKKFENIEVGFFQDEKLTATELGYVIDSAVA